MAAETYLRFVVAERHHKSNLPKGVFSALWDLDDDGALTPHEVAWWREVVAWFGVNLPQPTNARRSSKPNAVNRAVFWFRASATEHVSRMNEAKAILESHGTPVEVLRTSRPGNVVYEDAFQVGAEPFRGELTESGL